MTSSIRIVVFDLGGVMIKLAGGWRGACACAGIPYRAFVETPAYDLLIEQLETRISTGVITIDEYCRHLSTFLQELYNPHEIAAIYQAVIQEEFPGIYELVHGLRDAGYETACLSNTCDPHWNDLTDPAKYPGIAALHHKHASHLFGVAKPDLHIYQCFEQATGFRSGEILFFDDRPDNIAAARQCGWHALRIFPTRPSVEQIHTALINHQIRVPVIVTTE
jgi:FMN phosphatase YigB (HAD superfamily)